ncbi:MAG: glycosyltransferase family 4 protein [Candidatus Aenigmatarchaeota archaeon]
MDKKKKIAYILFSYPKYSETFIRDEINELRKYHDVIVFSIKTPEIKESNVIYGKKSKNIFKILKWTLYLLFRSWRDTKYIPIALYFSNKIKNNFDHIHTYFAASTATVSYIVSKETNIPFSFSAHSRDIFVKRESKKLMSEKIKHAKFVLVPSKWHKKYMIENYGFAEKYYIIPNSIYPNKFKPMKIKKSDQIIFIGRDVEKKGLKYLKEALELLGNKYKLLIISGGTPEKELIKELNKSKIFVLPSIIAKDNDSDGLATTLMEAMACELPVITTNIRAVPELVSGCGLLVEQKNPQQIADAIEKLMKNPNLCRKFGRNGRKRIIKYFDVIKNSKKLAKLIELK